MNAVWLTQRNTKTLLHENPRIKLLVSQDYHEMFTKNEASWNSNFSIRYK